jgi:trehalose synthase-fused probable maltokinase
MAYTLFLAFAICHTLTAMRFSFGDRQIVLEVKGHWERLFDRETVGALEAALPPALLSARWYGGKARTIRSARVKEAVPLRMQAGTMVMIFVEVSYMDQGHDTYTMLLTASFGEPAERIERACPQAVVAALAVAGQNEERQGLLHDALWDHDCAGVLLRALQQGARFTGGRGTLVAGSTGAFSDSTLASASAASSVLSGEQSNTSVKFGSQVMMKLYRRFEPGINPDLEIGRVLTARGFAHSPAVVGALEYVRPEEEPATVAIVHAFIENQGDAWRYTLAELERELESVPAGRAQTAPTSHSDGNYAGSAALLGRRTAELHLTLAQETGDPAFTPEPCAPGYWQSLRDRMTHSIERALASLRRRLPALDEEDRRHADSVLALEGTLLSRVEALTDRNPSALRIRCHGDFHLGQVLYTGRDFVIIDFEGEPARPLAERRAKHVPILDIAGMIRSFHYAAYAVFRRLREERTEEARTAELEQRARRWYRSAAHAFLSGYTAVAEDSPLWLRSAGERDLLLDLHLIEKACYELDYELNNRPDWAGIPLMGILQLFEPEDRRRIGSGVEATPRTY